MNRLAPLLLLLMLLTLAALVLLSRTSCPLCGRPVYLFLCASAAVGKYVKKGLLQNRKPLSF